MFKAYSEKFHQTLDALDLDQVLRLAKVFGSCWQNGNQLFIAGNGGSAGNAIHLANDYSYGCAKHATKALRVQSLAANSAVLTCLANDEDYSKVFSLQLRSYAQAKDVLLVLSGSGNSPNILAAIYEAKRLGMIVAGILGFDGGKASALLDVSIHIPIDDMQIAEDFQLVVGHMVMKWLSENVPSNLQLNKDEIVREEYA